MRKIILLFGTLLCLTAGAQAQSDTIFKRINAGVKVGVNAGFALPTAIGNGQLWRAEGGYTVMIDFIEYRFQPHWGAHLGFGFSNERYQQRSGSVYIEDFGWSVESKNFIHLQRIEVPLTLRYYAQMRRERQWYGIGGGSLLFNLAQDFQQVFVLRNENTLEYNLPSDIDRTSFAVNFGAGLLFHKHRHLTYFVEWGNALNFTPIHHPFGNDTRLLFNTSVFLGLRF
jgi:hypothetical protein